MIASCFDHRSKSSSCHRLPWLAALGACALLIVLATVLRPTTAFAWEPLGSDSGADLSLAAADPAHQVPYVGSDGLTYIADEALVLTSGHTSWVGISLDTPDPVGADPETFYYVQNDVTISGPIVVQNNINLILGDGATLTIANGINVNSDNDATLNIFCQPGGTGRIYGPTNGQAGQAGIGCGAGETCGGIIIAGGTIDVTGGLGAAGIGGGAGSIGNVVIVAGTITAHGGAPGTSPSGVRFSGGAGIGNGGNSNRAVTDSGRLGIQPGYGAPVVLNVTGAEGAAGIGGGSGNTMGVNLTDCTVNAVAGPGGGAGIGGGRGGQGMVTIIGGTVTATSPDGVGVGAGVGYEPSDPVRGASTINVLNDVTLSATGAYAGIGGGALLNGASLTGFSPAEIFLADPDQKLSVTATATSSAAGARALSSDPRIDLRHVVYGNISSTPLIDVVGISGGAEPDWSLYRYLKIQPLSLSSLAIEPSFAEATPGFPTLFAVTGEASSPSDFPKDQDLASLIGASWSVSGNSSPQTVMTQAGVLSLADDELAKTLRVNAEAPQSFLDLYPGITTQLTARVVVGSALGGDDHHEGDQGATSDQDDENSSGAGASSSSGGGASAGSGSSGSPDGSSSKASSSAVNALPMTGDSLADAAVLFLVALVAACALFAAASRIRGGRLGKRGAHAVQPEPQE